MCRANCRLTRRTGCGCVNVKKKEKKTRLTLWSVDEFSANRVKEKKKKPTTTTTTTKKERKKKKQKKKQKEKQKERKQERKKNSLESLRRDLVRGFGDGRR